MVRFSLGASTTGADLADASRAINTAIFVPACRRVRGAAGAPPQKCDGAHVRPLGFFYLRRALRVAEGRVSRVRIPSARRLPRNQQTTPRPVKAPHGCDQAEPSISFPIIKHTPTKPPITAPFSRMYWRSRPTLVSSCATSSRSSRRFSDSRAVAPITP